MNCVLLVEDVSGRTPSVEAARVSLENPVLEVSTFDRYFECSDDLSALGTSLMTGVYPSVHGVDAGGVGPTYAGRSLPSVLQRAGIDCIGLAPPSVLIPRGLGDSLQVTEDGPGDAFAQWLVRRSDNQRPFFVHLWGCGDRDFRGNLQKVFDGLIRCGRLSDTFVVRVPTRSRTQRFLPSVDQSPMQLTIHSCRGRNDTANINNVVGTVDLAPTVLELIGDPASKPPYLQGRSLMTAGGAVIDTGNRSVFFESNHPRSGVGARIVHKEASSFSVLSLDNRGFRSRLKIIGRMLRGQGYQRRMLLELALRGTVERMCGGGSRPGAEEARSEGRRELQKWAEDCQALAHQIRAEAETKDDAVLNERLRSLGYLG